MRTSTSRSKKTKRIQHEPRRHNLDRHAARIAAEDSDKDDEDLLTTKEVAEWFRVSEQWLEIGRGKNYGPEFEQLGPRMIRYLRGKCRKWLKQRSFSCTSQYTDEDRRTPAMA